MGAKSHSIRYEAGLAAKVPGPICCMRSGTRRPVRRCPAWQRRCPLLGFRELGNCDISWNCWVECRILSKCCGQWSVARTLSTVSRCILWIRWGWASIRQQAVSMLALITRCCEVPLGFAGATSSRELLSLWGLFSDRTLALSRKIWNGTSLSKCLGAGPWKLMWWTIRLTVDVRCRWGLRELWVPASW